MLEGIGNQQKVSNMERTYVEDTHKHSGDRVLLKGFVHEVRDIGKLKFLLLRDITGIIQITSHKEKTKEELFKKISKLARESSIEVTGEVKSSKQAPNGYEIIPEKIEVLNESEILPIDISERSKTDLSKRLDWRAVDLRSMRNAAIFKIQSKLIEGMQEWLNKNGFRQVFTPCIMGVPSESGSEVFQLIYFGKPAFLRQDPQLHRQLTIAGGIEKLYEIGPSWRAEKSHTVKHLCEHRTCAVELAFIKDETDTMRVEEQLIVHSIKKVLEECKDELKLLDVDLKSPKIPFPELKFSEIYDILRKHGKKIKDGEDIDTESEKILWDYVKKKYDSEFYFFNGFPHKVKPFYVMGNDEKPWARSVDLNYKGLELSSGGQREHRYDKIIKNAKDRKMNLESIDWFAKFFKYGCPPHGGFAIGIERLTQMMLNLPNVREATLFPRDPERNTP